MKKLTPLHFYIFFVALILIARLFENKVDSAYYLLVVLGWACFFIAVKKYFSKSKAKPRTTRRK
jgi:positive regulator of sigma E activity